jgi:hypothetical protein
VSRAIEPYSAFLDTKTQAGAEHGFDPVYLPDFLFDFQRDLVSWAVSAGRCALFEDCGMGKTAQFLVWAENVAQYTGRRVLILSPLAVAAQTVREAERFGIAVERSRDGVLPDAQITITNYERLHLFNPEDFAGVVCDESSILKSFDGATRTSVTTFMRKIPYRLLCTATAAPNDYIELGTSSEALGYLGHVDVLHRFFVNDRNNNSARRMYGEAPEWRFKGHAELAFWRWVSSWARAIRRPSDIGFDDGPFVLPPMIEHLHEVEANEPDEERLFTLEGRTLLEQRKERRRSIGERCEKVASIVDDDDPALIWCHLNDEGDALERMIDGAIQVSGRDSDEDKEAKFMGFVDGEHRALIVKPQIGAWGLNFQHCARVVCFPTHSYEQHYQGVRRCWRFGQKRPVDVHIVYSAGERKVFENLARKSAAADEMFSALVREMRNAQTITRTRRTSKKMEVPTWLTIS